MFVILFWDNGEPIVTQLCHPMLIQQDIIRLQSIVEETRNNSSVQKVQSLGNSN